MKKRIIVKNCLEKGQKLLFLILVVLCAATALPLEAKTASASSYIGSSAASMITLECSTNRVLYQKNADQRRPMASTTKIMTAITVLELCQDIEHEIRVPKEAVGIEGSSIYLQANERLTIKDLLYGLMLQSGNDCAVALAILVSGSVFEFAIEMNKLARKIGANNSNFVNPHGLHNDNHYTTARELGLIASYAMKNPVFREIVGTKKYSAPWEGRDYNRVIVNKNKILNTVSGGNGVKTGYTKRAGRCLVSAAERDGMQIISVVLNCGPMFEECQMLMNRAFENYSMTHITSENQEISKILVRNSKQSDVKIGATITHLYPLTKEEKKTLHYQLDIVDWLEAPISCGTEVGSVKVFLGNQLLFCEKLYTIEEADPLSIRDHLKHLIKKWNQV